MATNRELKKQYLQTKPQMGVFIIKDRNSSNCYIDAGKDLKAAINRASFTLGMGKYQVAELQQAWKDNGADSITIEILDTLDYDKDESKTDYTDDLALLREIWEEKLQKQGLMLCKYKL